MNLELKPATPSDAQLVYDVTEATMRDHVERTFGPWDEIFQRGVIGKSFDPATHFIILADANVAGVLAAPDYGTHIQLEKLYILPPVQRMGIGSRLLRDLIAFAASRDRPLRLRVLAVNTDAKRLYERFGFVVTGSTPERVFMEYRGPASSASAHE